MEICFQWVFIQFISPILLVYDTMTKLKKKKIFDKRADVLMNLVFSLFFFKNDFFFYSSSEDFIILHVMTVTDNESSGFGIQFKKKKNCFLLVLRKLRCPRWTTPTSKRRRPSPTGLSACTSPARTSRRSEPTTEREDDWK